MGLIEPNGIYKSITTMGDLRVLVEVITDHYQDIGVDTETTSVDYLTCDLLGISIAYKPESLHGVGYYIPVRPSKQVESLWDNPNNYLELDVIREHLNKILSNPNITKYLHNAKYDMHVLKRHGFTLEQPIYDTMIGAIVLGNVANAKYGLKDLVEKKLNIKMLHFDEVTGKDKDFSKTPLDVAVKYAGPDGDLTLRLAKEERKAFDKFPSLIPTMDLELSCIPVLQSMEELGARIDIKYLSNMNKKLKKEMDSYLDSVYKYFGKNFNVNSEDQLIKELRIKFPKDDITDVQASTLDLLVIKYPTELGIKDIINYRKRLKLSSVYCEGMIKQADKEHKVHTAFYQMLKTGRISSKNPNLQNIPTTKDGSDLPSIRRAFIADPGCKFVSIDYSQLELRVITHVADEPYWIKAFENNEDIHLSTAAAVLKKDQKDVTKYERKTAKFTNFGLLYGETAYGLSGRTGMSLEEADTFIKKYFSVLPKVKNYIDDIRHQVLTRKYTETFNGRRLYYNYDNKTVNAAIREGTNQPIQGGAADIVKKAMVYTYDYLKPFKSKMILQVHDELDLMAYEDELPTIIPHIQEIMSNVFQLKVELKTDCELGDNWEDIKDWNNE